MLKSVILIRVYLWLKSTLLRRSLYDQFKETTFERADFTLQMLKFVTAEKEREMLVIFFLSIFCQLLSPRFKSRTGSARTDHESSDVPAEKAAFSNAVSLD